MPARHTETIYRHNTRKKMHVKQKSACNDIFFVYDEIWMAAALKAETRDVTYLRITDHP